MCRGLGIKPSASYWPGSSAEPLPQAWLYPVLGLVQVAVPHMSPPGLSVSSWFCRVSETVYRIHSFNFSIYLVFERHSTLLRTYSQLCVQGSLMAGFRGPYRYPQLGLAVCNTISPAPSPDSLFSMKEQTRTIDGYSSSPNEVLSFFPHSHPFNFLSIYICMSELGSPYLDFQPGGGARGNGILAAVLLIGSLGFYTLSRLHNVFFEAFFLTQVNSLRYSNIFEAKLFRIHHSIPLLCKAQWPYIYKLKKNFF